MRALFKAIVATAALLAAPLYANATPVTFDLAGGPKSFVQVTDFNPGFICIFCGIDTDLNSNLGSLSASLDVGQSWTFDFFEISFFGIGGGTGTISAALGFDAPTGAPTVGGLGNGGFATFLGFITGGNLTWTNPVSYYTLADGTSYSVAFSNLSGLTTSTATVRATISRNVPEPTTLALFGLALLAIGLVRRRWI
jgi:PEP-CTERM motif-containing protein